MLKIFNDLAPFFEDNYRRIHVREYAKIAQISPPTASKTLASFEKQRLLKKEIDKQYFYYVANTSSSIFKDLQRIYWKQKLEEAGIVQIIQDTFLDPTIILFGSLVKVEARQNSDIDIAIFSVSSGKMNLSMYESLMKREIQVFSFKNLGDVPNNLKKNISNGYLLEGSW